MMFLTTQWFCVMIMCSVLLFVTEVDSKDKPKTKIKTNFEIIVEYKPSICKEESAVGDRVTIHYTGKLGNGQIFDSSIKRQRDPIGLTLGAGQVIEGWEKGLLGMCVGEKRQLTIPSSMGYGDTGYPPVIPGGATLHFDVSMVSLEKGSEVVLASSIWSVLRMLSLPVCLIVVVYLLYFRYKQEIKTTKEEKRKSKKRR